MHLGLFPLCKKIYPNVLTPVVSRVEWEWSGSGVDWGGAGRVLDARASARLIVPAPVCRKVLDAKNCRNERTHGF